MVVNEYQPLEEPATAAANHSRFVSIRPRGRTGEHELSWMREQIGAAHQVEPSIESRWPEAADHYSAPKSHYRHSFSLEKQEKGKRCHSVINRDFFQVKGYETRQSKGKMPSTTLYHINTPLVLACARLPDEQRNWVRYAYTTNGSWDHEQGAVVAVWKLFSETLSNRTSAEKIQKLKGLCYLCLQDAKHRKNNDQPLYKPARLRELTDISASNWRRDWLPHWKKMQAVIDVMDRHALKELLVSTRRKRHG